MHLQYFNSLRPKLNKLSLFILFKFLTCYFTTTAFSQQNYSITINDVPKQKLLSVGSSAVQVQEGTPAWAIQAMSDSIYTTLGFNALRLWSNTEQNYTVNDMISELDNYYIQSG